MTDKVKTEYEHPNTLQVPFTVTAHAGAMGTRANSLSSLRKAVLVGADIVEVDVSLRPNGIPVIIHNSAPSSRQGVLLEQAFIELAESSVQINLDLKSFNTLQTVQQLVEKYRLLDRAFFTGVTEKEVCQVRAMCPLIPCYLNATTVEQHREDERYAVDFSENVASLGCIGLNCQHKQISRALVLALAERNLLTSVWTVDKAADILAMLELGVNNITTKRPNKVLAMLSNKKK